MKYCSLDIETTGLDPKTCDILEIGAYIEDTNLFFPREKLPSFHCYIWKENYRGEAYALQMNHNIFKKILDLRTIKSNLIVLPEFVGFYFRLFLTSYLKDETPTIAGKNVMGFDIPFLKELPGWDIKFRHRAIDPAILYFDPSIDDVLPDTSICKKRAGLSEVVSHEALDDAWDVIQLIRYKFPKK